MTKILPLMLVAASSLIPSLGLVAQDTTIARGESFPLDVMTFNIRTAMGRDGDNVWQNRRDLVAETIRRSGPHVVGLQEVLTEQIKFLELELPDYRWLGIDRGLNGGKGLSESTPIFYRYDELSPIESGNFWLSDTPDSPTRGRRPSRIVTWAKFHHLETGHQIYVFNTHFSSRRGQRQIDAVGQINARISALPPGSTIIVTGDFNAIAETSDTWLVATDQGLQDAWVVAGERRGPAITSNGFGPPPEGWEGRIDWILVGGSIGVRLVETIVYSQQGRYPSDHYPVVANLEVTDSDSPQLNP